MPGNYGYGELAYSGHATSIERPIRLSLLCRTSFLISLHYCRASISLLILRYINFNPDKTYDEDDDDQYIEVGRICSS